MEIYHYLNSLRIQDIMLYNPCFTYATLDNCCSKHQCMTYLKNVYKCPSNAELSNLDYYNLFDICYILSIEQYNFDDSRLRCNKADNFIRLVKLKPIDIARLLDKYCDVEGIS